MNTNKAGRPAGRTPEGLKIQIVVKGALRAEVLREMAENGLTSSEALRSLALDGLILRRTQ